ncbi:hypothetical protein AB1Y20_020543 [Prymnesium parvum]|uniref:Kinesin-like protein n=1 Tax=Prymnesium parvum TaxID=97485 RepID=A0AB34JVG2_PRYPA
MTNKAHIEVYARVRPVKKPSSNFEIDYASHALNVNIPRDHSNGVNNQREHYAFAFSRVLDQTTTQEQVFETVAQPVVDSVLEGYNGTIFAYGQTGSGKTFTITGGAERYADRGIIPRTISYIFQKLQGRTDCNFEVRISYLEIYNEYGYDLLDPSHETKGLEDLPKVSLQEDDDGKIHLKNLSSQLARTEEEALNQLFVGDTNRMISETPMNMASSRSHCIFTISVDARKPDSDVVRRSKLHLVDLAGSERVKKTGIEGTILREAKYINLSLHFLEQVIIALQERSKFVPYRNSMMTSVLRDSLGGNCKTVMVATMSSEAVQLDETISTCRFAQRVALIANKLEINEEVDPKLLIARLKAEVRELKEEIQILRGEGYERAVSSLNDTERARCAELVRAFVADPSEEATLTPGEMAKVQLCFRLLREQIRAGGNKGVENGGGRGGGADPDELHRLKLQLEQRDHEINILVSMLNKGGSGAASAAAAVAAGGGGVALPKGLGLPGLPVPPAAGSGVHGARSFQQGTPTAEGPSQSHAALGAELAAKKERVAKTVEAVGAAGTQEAEALLERNAAFEAFRRSYRKNEVIEDNKLLLKQKYEEAKKLGESVNRSRSAINSLKGKIESVRQKQAASSVAGGDDGASAAEEDALREQMEIEKRSYKEGFAKLKEHKAEIEHLQHLLEQSRRRLQQDFENWFAKQRPSNISPQNGGLSVTGSDEGYTGSIPRSPAGGGAGPMLTGNKEVDAEIMAFYQARESLIKKRMAGGSKA